MRRPLLVRIALEERVAVFAARELPRSAPIRVGIDALTLRDPCRSRRLAGTSYGRSVLCAASHGTRGEGPHSIDAVCEEIAVDAPGVDERVAGVALVLQQLRSLLILASEDQQREQRGHDSSHGRTRVVAVDDTETSIEAETSSSTSKHTM